MKKNQLVLTSHLTDLLEVKKTIAICDRFYFFKYMFLPCSCEYWFSLVFSMPVVEMVS